MRNTTAITAAKTAILNTLPTRRSIENPSLIARPIRVHATSTATIVTMRRFGLDVADLKNRRRDDAVARRRMLC